MIHPSESPLYPHAGWVGLPKTALNADVFKAMLGGRTKFIFGRNAKGRIVDALVEGCKGPSVRADFGVDESYSKILLNY